MKCPECGREVERERRRDKIEALAQWIASELPDNYCRLPWCRREPKQVIAKKVATFLVDKFDINVEPNPIG